MEAFPPSRVERIYSKDLRILQNIRSWTIAHDVDAIGTDYAVLDINSAGTVKVKPRPAVLVRLQVVEDSQRGISPSRSVRDEPLSFVVVHDVTIKGIEPVVARRTVRFEPEANILRARRHILDKVVPTRV